MPKACNGKKAMHATKGEYGSKKIDKIRSMKKRKGNKYAWMLGGE